MIEEKKLRAEINGIVKAIHAESLDFPTTKDVWSHMKAHFGKSQELCDVPELLERKKFAENLLEKAKAEREARKNWWPKHPKETVYQTRPLVREAKTLWWPPRTDV